jgi:hypothetical protein
MRWVAAVRQRLLAVFFARREDGAKQVGLPLRARGVHAGDAGGAEDAAGGGTYRFASRAIPSVGCSDLKVNTRLGDPAGADAGCAVPSPNV